MRQKQRRRVQAKGALEDLRDHVDGRPAGALALRVCPVLPGHVPSLLTEAERALV